MADVSTFEEWMEYQKVQPAQLRPEELEDWREAYQRAMAALEKAGGVWRGRGRKPGEQYWAVVVREGANLWLFLVVRRNPKGEYFVLFPRADRGWDAHASYTGTVVCTRRATATRA